MFSPSQFIQSVMQRSPVQAPKPVELTPGQVFKGTVIKQYPDNMALVQIGGMQVQAKMEANLEPGQKAWLQVQPSSDVVTLKVLETPSEGSGKEATMEGLMRSLGLPETKESRVIVSALLNANLPVNKETVQAFAAVAQRLGVDDATIEAFMLAAKRNLPLTPDTVAGLKAFMSAKPLDQAIQNFQQQAALFLAKDSPASQQAGSSPRNETAGATTLDLRQVVSQVKEKLAGLPVLVAGESGAKEADQAQTTSRPNVSTVPGQNPGTQGTASTQTAASNQASGGILQGNQTAASAKPLATGDQVVQVKSDGALQQSANVQNAANQTGNAAGNVVPGKVLGQAELGRVSTASELATPPSGVTSTQSGQDLPRAVGVANSEAMKQAIPADSVKANAPVQVNVNGQPTTTGASAPSNPIADLFRQLGLGHERSIMGQAISGGSVDAGVHKQMESVKSLLLQITQAPPQSVPHALREAADQILQQITGQQLMMLQPSNQTLSQMVLQIPIRTDQGDDTAFVQIESKKKDGGQVDAENCRLFFHLELQSMGTTMIDVSIVNRIVNLQIFNDAPWVEPLISGMKDNFAGQLHEVGYHLSAMRVQPVPDERSRIASQSGAKRATLTDYKGVDLRV
ncbi:hypothetical protein BRE01_39730 [Brevibacillus reuszeri]|uniref:Flagellar hook-length control protein FliK n=1 Tax=Brevibacillus reuszeri TaxID=54915 RepID=A0A0K9YVH8_9BACL|nr:hypothetical protein [Brevibacillus reuszeri]KNB72698.1 hypothetical protein ADS79_12685 [Brevibacillus reuszeri]MED1860603.1 hypothetical protein [Brevibacillus reuszeri]GED70271.1 hypothetical protein BRE01_39730 [Brevibacillus reuszeri]